MRAALLLALALAAASASAQFGDAVRLTGNATFTPIPGPLGSSEALLAEVEVDVREPGRYEFRVALSKGLQAVAAEPPSPRSIPFWLVVQADAPGVYTAGVHFSGEAIYQSGLDGPYDLVLSSLLQESGLDTLRTPPFRHEDFGQIFGRISNATLRPADDDGDGRYEGLDAAVTVSVRATDRFALYGRLSYADGSNVASASSEPVRLLPGLHTLTVRFPSTPLHRYGRNGVHEADLVLISSSTAYASGSESWKHAEARSAILYAADFEPVLEVREALRDTAVDADADGLLDMLRVTVPATVNGSEARTVEACLFFPAVPRRGPICRELARLDQSAPELTFDFDGPNIRINEIDGPYRVWIRAYDAAGQLIDRLPVPGETGAYDHATFSRRTGRSR